MYYPIGVFMLLMVFRQVALSSTIILRKRAYILKTWVMMLVVICFSFAGPLYFVPLARTATTDRERTRVLFAWLLVVSPLVATLTGIVRSLKDGPALQTSPAITFVAFGFALFPRVVQAKMEYISSQQMHAYSLTELTVLIFTNLFNITVGQILFPSVRHLLERLVGLGLMVLIEVFFEGALYICLVRSANLPLIKSITEPGVIRMHLLALGIGGTAVIIRNAAVLVLILLTAADENKYQSVSIYEFCPFHSRMFELP
ncbi:unnamed protein product [Vitrella brassicaformis CCMP3155]|uniref:Uncharacterized protein n=1 Tax=Vitrella brassicaformis (strain CCMP3155) TaxID=1169540 RepID=A0A0G4G0C3_VITBC|nr:unnamed protein product [Vitrella brassicaformis CCMP3155]|eukprot:CEM21202.1 unnamed protein product [Vitrella brassicaformis CCMP3155]